MLKIRNEQVDVLNKSSREIFVYRMLAHIEEYFPAHFEKLGQKNCRELIHFGIERGEIHDFISERNVCKYIDLMLCFGAEFDTDSEQAWAFDVLTNDSWVSADAKMSALFEQGISRLEA